LPHWAEGILADFETQFLIRINIAAFSRLRG